MKHILFISTKLGGGGAERIISYLLNEFSNDNDKKITLLLLKKEGNTYLDYVSKNVEIVNLCIKSRIRYAVIKIVKEIIKLKPDLCFVGLDKLNIMLALFLPYMKAKGISFIVRETNVLSLQYNYKNPIIKFCYKHLYNLYDKVIAQSHDMANDLINIWEIDKKKVELINNPIDIDNVTKESNKIENDLLVLKDRLNLIAIGRLTYQKGYDILFKRLSELPSIPFHLYILGDGPLLKDITHMIDIYGIKNNITLLGYKKNPYPYLKIMDGIILSSRHEGFPNVLLEANALGKPIFTNKCPGGINEIIIEGINGISCNFNSSEDFRFHLEKFINTRFDSNKIIQLTQERYNKSIILPKYRAVFNDVLRKNIL